MKIFNYHLFTVHDYKRNGKQNGKSLIDQYLYLAKIVNRGACPYFAIRFLAVTKPFSGKLR